MYLLIEVSDPKRVSIIANDTAVSNTIREVARIHRLSSLTECAEFLNELEDEIVRDIRQKHAAAERRFGTPDLRLVKDPGLLADVKGVLPFGQPDDVVAPHVAFGPDDDGDDSDDDDTSLQPQ